MAQVPRTAARLDRIETGIEFEAMALGTFSGSKGDGTLAAPGPAAKNSAARSALPKTFHVEPSTHIRREDAQGGLGPGSNGEPFCRLSRLCPGRRRLGQSPSSAGRLPSGPSTEPDRLPFFLEATRRSQSHSVSGVMPYSCRPLRSAVECASALDLFVSDAKRRTHNVSMRGQSP
jgi:hypothetical protein